MNIAVFLDDVTAANGPLLFLPKSRHHHGVISAGHDLETTSYPLWITAGANWRRGWLCRADRPGRQRVDVFLLVHASPPNISPLPRTIRSATWIITSQNIIAPNGSPIAKPRSAMIRLTRLAEETGGLAAE